MLPHVSHQDSGPRKRSLRTDLRTTAAERAVARVGAAQYTASLGLVPGLLSRSVVRLPSVLATVLRSARSSPKYRSWRYHPSVALVTCCSDLDLPDGGRKHERCTGSQGVNNNNKQHALVSRVKH
ncbi:unnamed protein product [Nezara viridula]|uniref:Uncharacterized protein n=1 Tax=Nezara viridula TaxID=85310 RepID=A0A9P0E092_NEZVI|nr:unnamed protein product [Nezara viridula]